MPAPSIEYLLDFETNFEAAGQTILDASGVTSFIRQETVNLAGRDVYAGLALDLGAALDELTQIPAPSGWSGPPPVEFFRYDATFGIRLAVKRDKNDNSPDPIVTKLFAFSRARIRRVMMLCCAPFNSTNLPYYEVSNLRPNGSFQGFEQARNIDFQELRWTMRFCVAAGAWPAWQ